MATKEAIDQFNSFKCRLSVRPISVVSAARYRAIVQVRNDDLFIDYRSPPQRLNISIRQDGNSAARLINLSISDIPSRLENFFPDAQNFVIMQRTAAPLLAIVAAAATEKATLPELMCQT
jgi:hypothetical protein